MGGPCTALLGGGGEVGTKERADEGRRARDVMVTSAEVRMVVRDFGAFAM